MLSFVADENFNMHIVNGVLRRLPDVDILRVQDALSYERIAQGLPMPGVFEVPLKVPINIAIEEILLLAECSVTGEWEGQVNYLPLK